VNAYSDFSKSIVNFKSQVADCNLMLVSLKSVGICVPEDIKASQVYPLNLQSHLAHSPSPRSYMGVEEGKGREGNGREGNGREGNGTERNGTERKGTEGNGREKDEGSID